MSALAAALASFSVHAPSKVVLEGSAVVEADDEALNLASSLGMWLSDYLRTYPCSCFTTDISAPPSLSSSMCSSPRPSVSDNSCVSAPIFRNKLALFPSRRNEHLAVFLPKNLWKVRLLFLPCRCNLLRHIQPDSLASICDNFYCQIKFSLFERRHVS